MLNVKKSIGLVAGGSIIGQLAMLAATPVLTRLYSPEELGLYALFVSITGLFSVVVALHYDLAIPLVKSELAAKLISNIALIATLTVTLVVSGGLFLFKDSLLPWINAKKLEEHLLAVPLVLLSSGLLLNKIGIARRKSQFRANAMAKATQGVFQPLPQLICGYYGLGIKGLIVGQVAGLLAGVLCFCNVTLPAKKGETLSRKLMYALAYRYRNFPLMSTAGSLVNALAAQLPVMALTSFFGAREAGYFALSFRVLQGPIRFVGSAISEVFFSMAVTAKRLGTLKSVAEAFYRTLLAFAVPTFIVVGTISPEVFVLLFGPDWKEAGAYSQYLTAWMFSLFVTTPLAILVSVLERQSVEVVFQIGYVLAILGSMTIGLLYKSASISLLVLGIVGCALTLTKCIWLLSLAGMQKRKSLSLIIKELMISSPWIAVLITLKVNCENPTYILGIATLIFGSIHVINYKLRRAYEFK